jgi:hypothetical protein
MRRQPRRACPTSIRFTPGSVWHSEFRSALRSTRCPPGVPLVSGLTATVTIRNGQDGEGRTLFQKVRVDVERSYAGLFGGDPRPGAFLTRHESRCQRERPGSTPAAIATGHSNSTCVQSVSHQAQASRAPSRDFGSERVQFRSRRLWKPNGLGSACCRGACVLFFAS